MKIFRHMVNNLQAGGKKNKNTVILLHIDGGQEASQFM